MFNIAWRSRFAWRAVIGVCIAWSAFGGCRAEPPLPTALAPGIGAPTTGPLALTLWHSETGAARTEFEALTRDFHTAYPDLTVTPIYVGAPDDLAKQVTAAIALGRTPDLVLATRRDLAQFARQGGLLALDDLRAAPDIGLSADDEVDFFPGLLDVGAFAELEGKLYGFPFDEEGVVLFYNEDLLHAAKFAKPPATWNEFSELASKMTVEQRYGWAMQADADVFAAMLVSQGSALLDPTERRALFAASGGVAAMNMVAQLSKSGAAHLKPDADAVGADFAQGRAVLVLDWMSRWSDLQAAQQRADATFNIGVSNLPQLDPQHPAMLVRGFELGILKRAAGHARSAWFFIRWLTAARQTARWARAADAIPLRASALTFLAGERVTQIQNSLGATAPRFVPRPAPRHSASVERSIAEAWLKIAQKADVPSTLDDAAARVNQILATNP